MFYCITGNHRVCIFAGKQITFCVKYAFIQMEIIPSTAAYLRNELSVVWQWSSKISKAILTYILNRKKKYPLFLSKSKRMHFGISVNLHVPFMWFARHRRTICKKNCHQFSSDMKVITARPVFSKSDNKLVLACAWVSFGLQTVLCFHGNNKTT